eukprot:3182407-Alexandrium_andersonii.AAC.1
MSWKLRSPQLLRLEDGPGLADEVRAATIPFPCLPAPRKLGPGLGGVLEEVVARVGPRVALHLHEDGVTDHGHLPSVVLAPVD